LLCTFARGKDAARLTPWVLWMTLRTRVGTRRARRRAFLEMLFPRDTLDATKADELAAKVGALVGRDLADSPPILLQQLRALARHDVSAQLGKLAGIPSFVLSAELDLIARPPYGRALAAAIPSARFELFPHAAHGVTISEASAINERLRELFRSAETRNCS
jgi:3-oxoadipate enol-lactonase